MIKHFFLVVFMYSTIFSCLILMNLNFSHSFSNDAQILNFMKIRPVGGELVHADSRTDTKKQLVTFRNFPIRLLKLCYMEDALW